VRVAVIALLVCVGCGPRVIEPPSGDGTGDESGDDGESGVITSEDDGGSSSGTVYDDGSGGPGSVCGDGILGAGEACDDGNLDAADGCSPLCEVSGTSSWQVDLSPSRGVGVGLDARDGHAFVLVEDYHDGVSHDVEAISHRVSSDGQLLASFAHLGGLADLDLVRDAIASTPEGHVIVGYPSPDGALGRIELGAGLMWFDPMDTWRYSAATRWFDGDVYTLRMSADVDSLAVLSFTDTGDPIDTLWLDEMAFGTSPLQAGAMFVRGPGRSIVFTHASGEPPQMHSYLAGEWLVDLLPGSPVEPPRAFLHSFEIVVWTETERIVVDSLDHLQPPTPRLVPGFVLTSFSGGFVILDGQRIDVYADDGTLRWSHESTATPRLAMPDGIGGLFVLADLGYQQGVVTLERLVL
jgi:cysteine-rich repeat protein